MSNRPKGALRSREGETVSKKMERRILKSGMTKRARRAGRKNGMTTKDNFS